MRQDVFLVVTIDTECDKGPSWQTRHPLEFTSVHMGIPQILMPFFVQFGIIPTFLLSPEVIQDKQSCLILSAINNCELGAHLHGEFIEPQADWDNEITDTPQSLYSSHVECQKLENLTRLFERAFSYAPRSFRAGRFGISPFTLKYLAELGYRVDSSVTPFWTHHFSQNLVNNFWGAPVFPYRPSQEDARKPRQLNILEVPVTISNSLFLKFPRWMLRRMDSHSMIHKRILPRLGFTIPKTMWLRPQRSSAKEMIEVARVVMKHTPQDKPVVLNMMYHSVEIIPGASPYASTQSEVDLIMQNQRVFFEWLFMNSSVKSVGLSEVPFMP
jgi:hypothetical protein